MKALQYREIGSPPEIVEIPEPVPGSGEIVLKVTAAGVCHSDEFIMNLPKEQYIFGLPLTLGHEGAGVVHALGEGVTHLSIGDAVAVYGPWGCGRCHNCSQGKENYCTNAATEGIKPPGLGAPGSMAEYMLIDNARHLVPLGDLDPVKNVALTDAGLTPYHAIKQSLPKLTAGTTAVVIGVGGLGHVGIQLLRVLSSATVIALDVDKEKLELAKKVGAHHALLSNTDAADTIHTISGTFGVSAVFDFVGSQPTVELASKVLAAEGDLAIVGLGGGAFPVGFGTIAYDVAVRTPYWGTRDELIEVFELAKRGQISVEVETFTLDEAPFAYERLRAGTLRGRAVIVPNG